LRKQRLLTNRRLKFGFDLGINYSQLSSKDPMPADLSISNGSGFRLGLLADYKLSDVFSITPRGELSFNQSHIIFLTSDGTEAVYDLLPTSLDFSLHFMTRTKGNNFSPYFIVGPNIKIPVWHQAKSATIFSTSSIFALDVGIGLNKAFNGFDFLPELRYSRGLQNLYPDTSIPTLKYHNISLVFNFLG
jgi:hypothetical protein